MSELKNIEQLEKEKQEELDTRVKAFNAYLIEGLGKFKLILGAVAFLTPDGKVNARPHVFDDVKAELPAEPKPEGELAKVD